MHIRQITLDDDGMPERITAELTRQEARYLALITGKQNSITAGEIMPDGAVANSEIYSALTGELFNRYYEDGVDGVQ